MHLPYGDYYCFPHDEADVPRKVWEVSASLLAPPSRFLLTQAEQINDAIADTYPGVQAKPLGAVVHGRMVAGGVGWTALTYNSGESFANGVFVGEGLRKDRKMSKKLTDLTGGVPEDEEYEWMLLLIGHEIGHRYDLLGNRLLEELVADVPSIIGHIRNIQRTVLDNVAIKNRLYSTFHRILLDALKNIYDDDNVDPMSRAYGISGAHLYQALVDSGVVVIDESMRVSIQSSNGSVEKFTAILASIHKNICIDKNTEYILLAQNIDAGETAKKLAYIVCGI